MTELFGPALLLVSLLTSLVVEALKALFSEHKLSYKPNTLAAIVSLVLSIGVFALYIVYTGQALTAQAIVLCISLCVLSWLTAMLGYDKVMQTIGQFIKKG